MRCTDCSRPVRPVVSLDIDGTLGDYHEHIRKFAEGYLNIPLPKRYDGSVNTHEFWGISLEQYRQVKLAYRQGGMKRTMPLLPGARSLIAWLNNQDVEVWISTTRPWLRLDNIDPDTREWLTRNHVRYDGLIYGEDKYHQLAKIVDPGRVVGIVDDLPEQVTEAVAAGLPAYIIDRFHNKGAEVEGAVRVPGLLTFGHHINDSLKSWEK